MLYKYSQHGIGVQPLPCMTMLHLIKKACFVNSFSSRVNDRVVEGGSSFWVCEFKDNLFSSTFTWYSCTIYLVCFSNFWVCGWNPTVLPFKWNLLSSTFTWCYLFFRLLRDEIWKFWCVLIFGPFCEWRVEH